MMRIAVISLIITFCIGIDIKGNVSSRVVVEIVESAP